MLFKKSTKKRTKVYKAKKATNKQIKKIVKKTIANYREVKSTQLLGTVDMSVGTIGQFPILQDGTVKSFNIALGTTSGNRIGNSVTIKKVTLRGVLYPLGYNSTTNAIVTPQEIRMIIASNKANKTIAPAASGMFQNGGANRDPTYTLKDQFLPINTDAWIVKKQKWFKTGYGADPTGSSNTLLNNDFKLNCKFNLDLTKSCPSTIIYNDSELIPTSNNIYCTFILSNADGTTSLPAITKSIRCEYVVDFEYTDA